jgi:hypothetical protein
MARSLARQNFAIVNDEGRDNLLDGGSFHGSCSAFKTAGINLP